MKRATQGQKKKEQIEDWLMRIYTSAAAAPTHTHSLARSRWWFFKPFHLTHSHPHLYKAHYFCHSHVIHPYVYAPLYSYIRTIQSIAHANVIGTIISIILREKNYILLLQNKIYFIQFFYYQQNKFYHLIKWDNRVIARPFLNKYRLSHPGAPR